jgi:hypothetical protein
MQTIGRLTRRSILLWLSVALLIPAIPSRSLHAQDEKPKERETRDKRERERKANENERLDRDGDKVTDRDEKLNAREDRVTDANERLTRDGDTKTREAERLRRDDNTLERDEKVKTPEESQMAERLKQNQEAGRQWESKTEKTIAEREGKDPYRQVTLESNDGTKSRADLIYQDHEGKYVLVECKASDTADFTRNQREVFGSIREGDQVTVRGNGLGEDANGRRVTISEIYVARPDENGNVRMEPYRDRNSSSGTSKE